MESVDILLNELKEIIERFDNVDLPLRYVDVLYERYIGIFRELKSMTFDVYNERFNSKDS